MPHDRLRVALFGSGGEMPATILRAVAARHQICAIVRPGPATALRAMIKPWAVRLGLRPGDPFSDEAARQAIPELACRGGRDAALAEALHRLDLDAIIIASFPYLLSADLFGPARLGGINVHTSLLPRHRGPVPMLWVYHADDRETGVTVHRVTARADAGAVLAQSRFDLPRGYPIQMLYDRSSAVGGQLAVEALDGLANGGAAGTPQDEAGVTPAPRVAAGTHLVDFAAWPAERVWHFLAGMYPLFREPLTDTQGTAVVYGGVGGFRADANGPAPGAVRASASGWDLGCRDGVVELAAGRPT